MSRGVTQIYGNRLRDEVRTISNKQQAKNKNSFHLLKFPQNHLGKFTKELARFKTFDNQLHTELC